MEERLEHAHPRESVEPVDDFLFFITCTTCQAKLKVRSEAAIGAILACPKCGSMVQVTPPAEFCGTGFQPVAQHGQDGRGTPPPLPAMPPPPELAGDTIAGMSGRVSPLAPAEMRWQKWLFFGAAPLACAVVALGAWSFFSSDSQPEPATVAAQANPIQPANAQPLGKAPEPTAVRLDRRWLPPGTQLLVSLKPSPLAGWEGFEETLPLVQPGWQSSIDRVVDGFGLRLSAIERLTWASTDLSDWPNHAVVLIQLAEGHSAASLRALGDPLELRLGGVACRRPKEGSSWPHPLAILDQKTLLTGREEILRQLADRSEAGRASPVVERFLNAATEPCDLLAAVDLTAARAAGWRLPDWRVDVWPAGRDAWRAIWELPQGLGVTFRHADRSYSELALVCDGESTASQVRDALAQLTRAAQDALSAKAGSLTDALNAGRLDAATADRYEIVLDQGRAALAASQWEVDAETVWGRVEWGHAPAELAVALAESREAIAADWRDAARAGDEANGRRILAGLSGHLKAEGNFPTAAGGGVGMLLPPETRLSWIAAMLPYYDHRDWHRELNFGYSWNSGQNRPVSRRPLDAVINPALGPSTTEAGYPLTHYVGVAGLGADAGSLPADDPRAGVFGFGRTTRAEDISDGLSNTVAVLGVSQPGSLGPWAAGGHATARPLTERPYVNGPDGFGSGQPDGMLAGMADGSVRFLSKDIDPSVLEQLVTIRGREPVTVAALEPMADVPTSIATVGLPSSGTQSGQASSGTQIEPPTVASRPPLAPVDVDAHMAGRVASLTLPGMSLADAVALVGQLAGLPVSFDLDNMAVLGVGLDDPVSCHLSDATIADVLKRILADRGLDYVVQNGQLLVTTPAAARNSLRSADYDVFDLAGASRQSLDELAALVRTMVAPDSWRTAGGRGTIAVTDGSLVVSQTDPVHYELSAFCDKLRLARGIPAQESHGKDFGLTSRTSAARKTLDRPVTTTFHNPAPLGRIVEELAAASDAAMPGELRIVVNWPALAAERIGPAATASIQVDGQPLASALDELLGPLGLAYRVVAPELLEITTRAVLADRLECEFHAAADLIQDGMAPDALAEHLKARIAGGTWQDAGGPAQLHLDAPSAHLIVLQSQATQAEVEAELEALRKERQ